MPFKANRYLLIEVSTDTIPRIKLRTDDLAKAKAARTKGTFIIDTTTGEIVR